MPLNPLYTTGELTGITRLKLSTIQRYIVTFRPYFSAQARVPIRGRRYTGEDVQKLFLIKHLYSDRKKKSEILEILSGEKPANVPVMEIADSMEIAATARRAAQDVLKLSAELSELRHSLVMENKNFYANYRAHMAVMDKRLRETQRSIANWVNLYKKDMGELADDLRYLISGKLSKSQQVRAYKKTMDEYWHRPPQEIWGNIEEWNRSKSRHDSIQPAELPPAPIEYKSGLLDRAVNLFARLAMTQDEKIQAGWDEIKRMEDKRAQDEKTRELNSRIEAGELRPEDMD